jgi:hypothetical protein
MPIPFLIPILLGGGSAALAAVGIGAGVDGVAALKEAKARGEAATSRHRAAVAATEAARDRTTAAAASLGERKLRALNGALTDVIALANHISQRTRPGTFETLGEVGFSTDELRRFSADVLKARDVFGGAAKAALAGAAAHQAALAGVGLVGMTAGGTAIGTLSGAAATNATLAWLGGGALAAGGGGMALGTAVLGGIVAGPALAIAGWKLSSEGEKALTEVRAFEHTVNVKVAELGALQDGMSAIRSRIREISGLIDALEPRLRAALGQVRLETWSPDRDADVRAFQAVMVLARALAEVIRAPVIDADGGLSPASAKLRTTHRALLA